jgi:hypothetical protein
MNPSICSATVIEAMGAGKVAAEQMDGFMRSKVPA